MAKLVNKSTIGRRQPVVIGAEAYEQLRFHRTDPYPNLPWEHELAARQRQSILGEIACVLAVIGIIALAVVL